MLVVKAMSVLFKGGQASPRASHHAASKLVVNASPQYCPFGAIRPRHLPRHLRGQSLLSEPYLCCPGGARPRHLPRAFRRQSSLSNSRQFVALLAPTSLATGLATCAVKARRQSRRRLV